MVDVSLDRVFAALADPTRRAIVERLQAGPLRVTEVAAPFPISLNAVSKHIKALETAGLARRTVAGRDHWIALEPAALASAGGWLDARRAFWERALDRVEAHFWNKRLKERE
jgi:DNA-binding transcriptional ArsR family regulator